MRSAGTATAHNSCVRQKVRYGSEVSGSIGREAGGILESSAKWGDSGILESSCRQGRMWHS
jgi:hypothetical protein